MLAIIVALQVAPLINLQPLVMTPTEMIQMVQKRFCETRAIKKSTAPHYLVHVLLHSQIIICSTGEIMNCLEIIQ